MFIGLSTAITNALYGGGAVYPLDDLSVSPVFAYSTRKLTSSYAGPAIRVIRPSDSAEADIGFVGVSLDTAALDAFLGAQTGRVLTRYDQSGNGNHSTQSTTALQAEIDSTVTLGGHRVVQFTDSYYPLPVAVALNKNNMHFFSVHEWLSTGLSTVVQFGSGVSQNSIFEQGASQIQANGGGINLTTKNQLSGTLLEYASNGDGVYLGANSESGTAAALASSPMTGGYIGNTSLSGGYEGKFFDGASIAFAQRLSAVDTTTARATLREAFGLAAVASDRVVFDGDSIVIASVPAALNYYGFAKMAQRILPSSAAAYNYAGGGNQIQNMIAAYATLLGSLLDYYPSDNRIVLLMVGTNDLTIGGRTAAQIYADIQTYAGLVRADGGKIIVSTILPNNAWSGAQQTVRTDLNALIRTNWASFADGLADFAADSTMGPQAAAANTALYPDGLHPSRLGHGYLAPIASAAINALL